jgi:hypothetical protein
MQTWPFLVCAVLVSVYGLSLPLDVSSGPGAPMRLYGRQSTPQTVVPAQLTTAVTLCDAAGDVATGGGFTTDNMFPNRQYHVFTSASCRASGLCAGPEGQDGWIVIVTSSDLVAPGEEYILTTYVTCARP